MRFASLADRLVLISADGKALDVDHASHGLFGPDPQAVFDAWDDFDAWARTAPLERAEPFDLADLRAPVPRPRQLFAVGINYGAHANEVSQTIVDVPSVFTKFVTCLTGPYADVPHPGGSLDWEAELVVVVARGGHRIPVEQAWGHVAGLTVGQDFSEREIQHAGDLPQFSLGKSYPGFGPMGPWVVTPDELDNPRDLRLETRVNGEVMQSASTLDMVRPVDALIAKLSEITPLLPGDVVFSGTPAGTGIGLSPSRYLDVGDVVATSISGIGSMSNTIVASRR